MAGNLPLSQGKRPDSTMIPPIEVPCPPMYLVAECTTRSAPVLEGAAEIRSRESVVDASGAAPRRWCAIVGHRRDVENVHAGIADGLRVQSIAGVDRVIARGKVRRGRRSRRRWSRCRAWGSSPRTRCGCHRRELFDGHDVVARPASSVSNAAHLRRHSRRRGDRRPAALERGDALLEDRRRRVHQARVDVPEGLEVEQARRVVGVCRTRTTAVWYSGTARDPVAESGSCPACRHRVSMSYSWSAMNGGLSRVRRVGRILGR